MATLVVIVGLPGSGKSKYIKEIQADFPGLVSEDFMAESVDHKPIFTYSRHYPILVSDLRSGKNCLIADVAYCDTLKRVEVTQTLARDTPDAKIEWRFYENNPGQCEKNARERARPGLDEEIDKIRKLTKKYFIPEGTHPLKVWSPN